MADSRGGQAQWVSIMHGIIFGPILLAHLRHGHVDCEQVDSFSCRVGIRGAFAEYWIESTVPT